MVVSDNFWIISINNTLIIHVQAYYDAHTNMLIHVHLVIIQRCSEVEHPRIFTVFIMGIHSNVLELQIIYFSR